jgi:FkbM family methyltransferase
MALKSIKVAGHNLLHRLGVDFNKYHPPGSLPTPVETRRIGLLAAHQIDVVLDVGANTGQYASGLRRFGYTGRIISFEPISSVYAQLLQRSAGDQNWECKPFALGAEAMTTTINIAGNNAESSSLLAMCDRHVAEAPEAAYVGREEIRIETLDGVRDSLLKPSDRIWLKLDVQGYEFSVLQGANGTLKNVYGLEAELSLVPLYEGGILMAEALERIGAMGFKLVNVEECFVDAQGLRTLQLNGIFERVL